MIKTTIVLAAGLLVLAGCAAPAPPDYAAQQQPAVDAYLAAWSGADLGGLDAVMTPDIKRRSPAGLNSDGVEALKKVMSDVRTAYPDAKVVSDESHHMKDLSFMLWTFTGTNTGPGPGEAQPTGKSVKLSGSTLMRYREGKIAEEIVNFDVLDWQMQLGYTLTPPAAPTAQ
jgi:ketosteroid isomerase-like protein